MGKVGDGEYPPVSRAVPDANETRNKWMEEVVGNKTDTTHTSKGTTYSLVAMAKGSLDNEATIIGLLQKDFVAERNEVSWCDVDNTARFEVSLIDNDTGPIALADITAGTITISRIRAGVTTVIVNAAAFSKANGKIYYDYTFAAASWATDDGFLAEAAGVSFTIGGAARYPSIPSWFGNIQDTSTIVGKIDTIDGIVDNILEHSVSVLADTAELQTDWTNGGRLDLILDDVLAHATSILADSDELQTDWTNGGRLDVILDSIASHSVSILADVEDIEGYHTVPDADSVDNVYMRDVIGSKLDSAAGFSLMSLVRLVLVYDNVPPTDGAANGVLRDVVGSKLDTVAGTSIVSITKNALAHSVSILADTNELQTDWVNGGRLDLILDGIAAHGVSILADTNELETDWTDGGRLDLLLDSVKASTDRLMGEAVVNSTATQNWNAAEADIVSIGTATTKKMVHSVFLDLTALTALSVITVRKYIKINGTERQLPASTYTIGTSSPGQIEVSELTIHDVLRITAQSNVAADDGKAIGYTVITEEMSTPPA